MDVMNICELNSRDSVVYCVPKFYSMKANSENGLGCAELADIHLINLKHLSRAAQNDAHSEAQPRRKGL